MTGIAGAHVGNYDGFLWGRSDFNAGKATGKTEGYDTLKDAMAAASGINGAEVISTRDGKYYLNEIRGTHYSRESQAEVTVRAEDHVRGDDGKDYAVVGFVDDYNNFIGQYDGDENLEMMGQTADIQKLLDVAGENLSLKDRLTFIGAANGIGSPRLMSSTEKITAALERLPAHLPEALRQKFAALIRPENIGIMAGALAVWAGSHAFGVGEVADAVLMGVGLGMLGADAIDVAKKFYEFADTAVNAQTDADLDKAAQSLADGISTVMVDGTAAAVTYGAAKVVAPRIPVRSPAGVEPVIPPEASPHPPVAESPVKPGVAETPVAETPVAETPVTETPVSEPVPPARETGVPARLSELPLGELRPKGVPQDIPSNPPLRRTQYEADLEPDLNRADARMAVRQRLDATVQAFEQQGLKVKNPDAMPLELLDGEGQVAVRIRMSETGQGELRITDYRQSPVTEDSIAYRSPKIPRNGVPGATEADSQWAYRTNQGVGDMPAPNRLAEIKGTSNRVGDFRDIEGLSVEAIVARIPKEAQLRELSPGSNQMAGFEYSWEAKLPDGSSTTMKVRIHAADSTVPPGQNAAEGWVAVVEKGGDRLGSDGQWYDLAQRNANNHLANITHIPIAGNPVLGPRP